MPDEEEGIWTIFRDNIKESTEKINGYEDSKRRISSQMKHWMPLKLTEKSDYRIILKNTEFLTLMRISF